MVFPQAGGQERAFQAVGWLLQGWVPTATGVGDIPPIAWNHVDVQVHHGLPGCFADIDSDIEAVGVVALDNGVSCQLHRPQEIQLLRSGSREPVPDVPSRGQHCVSRAHRVCIPQPQNPVALMEEMIGVRLTERARVHQSLSAQAAQSHRAGWRAVRMAGSTGRSYRMPDFGASSKAARSSPQEPIGGRSAQQLLGQGR